MSDIINLEKKFFSSLHSKFDTLLHNLSKTDGLDDNTSNLLSILNKEILNCENILDDINYNLISKKPKELTKKQKQSLKDNEEDKKCIKELLPYLISYRMMSM